MKLKLVFNACLSSLADTVTAAAGNRRAGLATRRERGGIELGVERTVAGEQIDIPIGVHRGPGAPDTSVVSVRNRIEHAHLGERRLAIAQDPARVRPTVAVRSPTGMAYTTPFEMRRPGRSTCTAGLNVFSAPLPG